MPPAIAAHVAILYTMLASPALFGVKASALAAAPACAGLKLTVALLRTFVP